MNTMNDDRYSYNRTQQYGYVLEDTYDYKAVEEYRNGMNILLENSVRQYLTISENLPKKYDLVPINGYLKYGQIYNICCNETADNKWLIHAYDLNGGFSVDECESN